MSNKFPLAELQTLLEQARQSDAEYKQFGAATHKYHLNPPAALADVEAFEQQLGCTLPEAYRSFLLQAGNGGAGPFYGLFSLEQMQGWLDWPVEPTETPYLQPDVKIDDLCYLQDNDYNWQRGCLPIGSQGDTYFTYLLLAGPHRGRVVYVEYELSWVFFSREPDFLVWYTRWLREVAAGYNIGWFGLRLDGDEAALRQHYTQADSAAEKLLALDSLKKFPALSPISQDFIRQIAPDWQSKTETGCLTELLYQIDPEQYEQFLAARWKAGIYDKVIYELYHTPGDKQALANRWYERILAKLPDIETKTYCIALPILHKGGGIKLEQVAFLLDKAQGREKYDLLLTFGRLPDAAAHLDFWLPLLAEREDLDLLLYALLSVPRLNNAQLREALLQVQAAFPYAQEQIYHIDYQNPEQMALSKRRSQEQKVYRTACTVWDSSPPHFHTARLRSRCGSARHPSARKPRPARCNRHIRPRYCPCRSRSAPVARGRLVNTSRMRSRLRRLRSRCIPFPRSARRTRSAALRSSAQTSRKQSRNCLYADCRSVSCICPNRSRSNIARR